MTAAATAADAAVVVYGASGHGRVVADIARALGLRLLGYVDDVRAASADGTPVLGTRAWLEGARARGVSAVGLGVGDNVGRIQVAGRCVDAGLTLATWIHPSAVVSPSARLGAGVVVMPGAVVNAGAQIGEGAIVNSCAVVEHDVVIGAYAHVSPNATLGGAARLGDRSHLGLGASVLPMIAVGADSVIGAGAVVARPIGDGVVALGVPARVRRAK